MTEDWWLMHECTKLETKIRILEGSLSFVRMVANPTHKEQSLFLLNLLIEVRPRYETSI